MSETIAAARSSTLLRDLLALTKPRIISLLLVTTVVPMYIAGQPSARLVLIVLVGGYLMAGGANAVNMYLDRDIDERMTRTRLRPIPSGRMTARAVLAFGIALAAAATWMLAIFAIVLAAALGLSRVYLRAHFVSDVAGGWGLAAAIFALCGIVALVARRLRQNGAATHQP